MTPALPYGLVAQGRWPEAAVELSWTEEPARAAGWADEVETAWQALLREEPTLHDAALAGLRGHLAALDRLSLTLSPSSYRVTVSTHRHFARFAAAYGLSGLGMGIAVAVGVVAEGGLVLARRSQRVFGGRGMWHPAAGHWEPDAHRDAAGKPSPFACARAEMLEELGLEAHELEGLTLIGVQLNPDTAKPELHMTARVGLTVAELSQRQQTARDAHEIDGLLLVRRAQVPQLVEGALGPVTEIGRACAYLHDALDLLC